MHDSRKILGVSVTAILAAFFVFGLLYPLGYALIEALREPVYVIPQKDESWTKLAERIQLDEPALRSLNNAVQESKAPPFGKPVLAGYAWTAQHLLRVFDPDAAQWRWIINSLLMAAAVTLLCAAISYPLAWLQARTRFWQQGLFGGLLLLPLVMPPFVGAIGLRRILARYGVINVLLSRMHLTDDAHPIDFLGTYRMAGCILVMVLHFYPLIYLNLAAAISNIDPSLLESSKSLGSTPWQTFRRVVLPLSLPGLIAGGSLVFVGAFTDLGTPLVFGYQQTVARQIFSLANEQTSNPAAPALVAVVTMIVIGLFVLTRWSTSRSALARGSGVKGQSRAASRTLSPAMSALAVGLHLAVIGLAILPHLSVVLAALGKSWFMTALPESFTTDNLSEALAHPIALAGMRNSLLYSLGSTSIDLVLGLACAWAIVRGGGWWGRVIDALSIVPLAIPGLVLAFGYVGAYASIYSQPREFHFLGLGFRPLGIGLFLILSYSVRRLPYTVRACAAGLEQTPRSLEEAANALGAPLESVLRRITLPLIFANVVAGGILAFSFAMLEVSDSLILATRPSDFPLTKSIYFLFGNPGNGDQLASALGLVTLVFLSFSLLAAGSVLGKKWGEMFRG